MVINEGDVVLCYWMAALNPLVVNEEGDFLLLVKLRAADKTVEADFRFRYYRPGGDGFENDRISRYGGEYPGKSQAEALAALEQALEGLKASGGFVDMRRVEVNGDVKKLFDVMQADPKMQLKVTKGPIHGR